METRAHKLLIQVGEEGFELQARDFSKITEVIVGEYLPEQAAGFRVFLTDMLVRVAREIPLKQHIYAGLTAQVAKVSMELAGKIVEAALNSLQATLKAGKFYQAVNLLVYLSELMNISFLNSLVLLNLLEDIASAAEAEHSATLWKMLVDVLPVCACSLNEKLFHEFKKLLERMRKHSTHPMLDWVHSQFAKNKLADCSLMARLDADFAALPQLSPKFKLHVEAEPFQQQLPSYLAWPAAEDQLYLEFSQGQGLLARCALEQLTEAFRDNKQLLVLKTVELIASHKSSLAVKYFVRTLLSKALEHSHPAAEQSLLLTLASHETYATDSQRFIDNDLFELFTASENSSPALLLRLATLMSFLITNWPAEWDWTRYESQTHPHCKVLLQLLLEKVALLNDKFVAPANLKQLEWTRAVGREMEYEATEDMEKFEKCTEELKHKSDAKQVGLLIDSPHAYAIFLDALFRRTKQSQTHLSVLAGRYSEVFALFPQFHQVLMQQIRQFFANSFFHRVLYLRHFITAGHLSLAVYSAYVSASLLIAKPDAALWLRLELTHLDTK